MQEYIITGFKRITDGKLWIRQEVGTFSGGYTTTDNDPQQKRLNDFICDGTFEIYSVKRQIDDITFSLDSNINILGNSYPITSIKIILSQVIILNTSNNTTGRTSILLSDAIKFNTPLVQIVQNRATRRARNTIVDVVNNDFNVILTKIENDIQPIRIQILKKRRETLKEFLVKFFTEWNLEKDTIFVENREVQTEANKRRSLGDIYMICKYYYPNCTLQDVIKLLYVDLHNEITVGFRTSKCNTINKRVWYYEEESNNGIFDKTSNDEYGHIWSWYINKLV